MARAFLLMPFKPEFDDLHRLITAAGKAVGVEIIRADDIFRGGTVIDQVKDEILQADAVVAVCTDRNPNVFFELGIAEAGHRPILVAAQSTDLPFDIKHWRAQFYGGTESSDSLSTLGERVQKALKETLAEPRQIAQVIGPSLAQRLTELRNRVTDRARGILGAMATYAPGDLSRFGDELEPLLANYFVALTAVIRADDMETFDDECRAFAGWTDLGLGPSDGYNVWIEMPRWLVWWTANACGMYAVFCERWAAIDRLYEHSTSSTTGRFEALPFLDAGAGGMGIGEARLPNNTERWSIGRDAAAVALARTLAGNSSIRPALGDFLTSEDHLLTLLAVYRYVSVLRLIADGKDGREWPWLYTLPRLGKFIQRVNQVRGYRTKLAERLFGRSVEGFEMDAPQWQRKVLVPPQSEPPLPQLGPFS